MTSHATGIDLLRTFGATSGTCVTATGGDPVGGTDRTATSLSTDTRSLEPGALFVALSGPTFDANDLLPEAADKGAAGLVTARGRGRALLAERDAGTSPWVVEVDDTLHALGQIARMHRSVLRHVRVVAVTGSNGKSTTKEMTHLVLSVMHPALKNEGNFNNRIGVPLTISRLTSQHRFAVIEMGMNEPGEIARLAEIAQPDIGIVTNVGTAHIGNLGSQEAIAHEKGALLAAIGPGGSAIVPRNDPLAIAQAARARGGVMTFGRHLDADVRAGDVRIDALEIRATVNAFGQTSQLHIEGAGLHLVDNALAAIAAGIALGVPLDLATSALSAFRPMKHRMQLIGIGAFCVLADCYNANPTSTAAAIDTIATMPAPRAIVLGAMGELGTEAVRYHEETGFKVGRCSPSLFIAVGAHGDDYARGALAAGLPAQSIALVETHQEAADLLTRLAPGTRVLVKGSRSARMELVLEALERAIATQGGR